MGTIHQPAQQGTSSQQQNPPVRDQQLPEGMARRTIIEEAIDARNTFDRVIKGLINQVDETFNHLKQLGYTQWNSGPIASTLQRYGYVYGKMPTGSASAAGSASAPSIGLPAGRTRRQRGPNRNQAQASGAQSGQGVTGTTTKKRKVSRAARELMSQRQKERWAARRADALRAQGQ